MPRISYYTPDGKRLRGTTTILGRFKDSGGLMFWAFKQGIEAGLEEADGKPPRGLYDARDDAATAGTIAHELIENAIHGNDRQEVIDRHGGKDNEQVKLALKGFGAFERWWEGSRFELVATETSLVSSDPAFGGTLDAIGVVDGELSLVDWKSGAGIYPEMLLQCSAYRHLFERGDINHTRKGKPVCDEPIHFGEKIQRVDLLRVGKEFGDFHHHSFPISIIDQAWEVFRTMPRQYDLLEQLKKAVR